MSEFSSDIFFKEYAGGTVMHNRPPMIVVLLVFAVLITAAVAASELVAEARRDKSKHPIPKISITPTDRERSLVLKYESENFAKVFNKS